MSEPGNAGQTVEVSGTIMYLKQCNGPGQAFWRAIPFVAVLHVGISSAVRIVSRRKARKALAVRLWVLGKGGDSGTPRGVSGKGEGI